MKRIIQLLIVVVSCWKAEGSLLSVSAEFDGPAPGDFSENSVVNSVSASFLVLVTGGMGSGFLFPELTLQGETNEGLGRGYEELGGIASTTWPQFIAAGDPFGPAQSSPQYSCGPFSFPSCAVPFTFGVPFTFDISLSASAVEELQVGSPLAVPIPVGSGASFDGISNFFTDTNGVEISAQATITELPEPASELLAGGAGLMLFGLGIFKRRK